MEKKISCNINDSTDVIHKRSDFMGYFNKLMPKFVYIHAEIQCNLFKTYCCSYHGSILWHYNSHGFDKYCTQWNKSVKKIFSLPNTDHIYITIVQECLHNAICNVNTIVEYKLTLFRNGLNTNLIENDINYSLCQVHPATLDMEDKSLIDCLHTLIMARSNKVTVDGFEMEELISLLFL